MLAVAGGKGGAGKTTTTLGLAGALARQRRTVLAVDADREMPDLHAMAGVARDPGLDAVASGWPARMVAGTADAPVSGVEVVPAASGPLDAERARTDANSSRAVESSSGAEPSAAVESSFARVGGCADAVLLDCPAGAGPDAVAPLRAADAAVVVTTPEPDCLRDAAKTAAMVRELDAPVAGAIVSRADDPPAGIDDLLDAPVLGVVPDVESESRETTTSSNRTPLASERARATYDALVSALQPKYL